MGLIDKRDLGARWSDGEIRAATARRLAWRACRGLDTPDNPYWDVDGQCYRLDKYEDDKAILADAYLDTLPAEQRSEVVMMDCPESRVRAVVPTSGQC